MKQGLQLRQELRQRLANGEKLLSMGTWDVLSAKVIEKAGYDMVALQSFQYAAGWGVPDVGIRTPSDLLEITFKMAGEINIPILIDLEEGFGAAGHAAYWAREFERAGAAVVHIDDGAGVHSCPWLAGADTRILRGPVDRTAAMISAIAEGRKEDLLIAARVSINPGEDAGALEDEELSRLQRYVEAGADLVFAPKYCTMTNDVSRLAKFVKAIGRPVLIQFNPPRYIPNYVPRGSTDGKSIADRGFGELFDAGVSIISSPQLYPVAYRALYEALVEVRKDRSLEPAAKRMFSLEEVTALLGHDRFTPSENGW